LAVSGSRPRDSAESLATVQAGVVLALMGGLAGILGRRWSPGERLAIWARRVMGGAFVVFGLRLAAAGAR